MELLTSSGALSPGGPKQPFGRVTYRFPKAGTYRIVFHPESPFFRRVELEIELGDGHYHVPLLVSSYGCASYRGS